MIHYHLRCERGHAFESWFQSSSAYEDQEKRKLVNCPVCGSTEVERAIMAPQIVSGSGRETAVPAPTAPAEPSPSTPSTQLMMAQEHDLLGHGCAGAGRVRIDREAERIAEAPGVRLLHACPERLRRQQRQQWQGDDRVRRAHQHAIGPAAKIAGSQPDGRAC